MPVVFVPPLLRELTGGAEQVAVEGATLGEVIDGLEARFPGVRARLVEDDAVRPGLAVVVDGAAGSKRLRSKVDPSSEIHFLPAISGG